MSDSNEHEFEAMEYGDKVAIDVICDDFEAKWRNGDRPQAELFLVRADGPASAILVGELLAIECAYRSESEGVVKQDYENRFPDLREVIQARELGSRSLMPDVILGDYQLVREIGAGGMGVVWEAKDTKLGRSVALKFLTNDFSHDSVRLKRFQREAKILAGLNHPNIATLYTFEKHGDQEFCVLEFVPGKTLAEVLRKRRLPISELVSVFVQIADALESAHETGIIHRDLKPANIKLTDDGLVKVLDFGLATSPDNVRGDSQRPLGNEVTADKRNSSTFDSTMTSVAGTLPYMSPEQAQGKSIDKRTDIWSFGCCLYEAIARQRSFPYQSAAEILEALADPAPDWAAIPGETPPRLKRLIRRCLEKDSRQRLRDIGDARIELRDCQTDLPEIAPWWRNTSLLATIICTSVVTMLLTASVSWFLRPPQKAANVESRMSVNLPDGLRLADDGVAIAPDGSQLVFAAINERDESYLYLRRKASFKTRRLEDTLGAKTPFFSPDGKRIGFCTKHSVRTIAVSEGKAITVWRGTGPMGGGCWMPNGRILFASHWGSKLAEVSPDGSNYRLLALGHASQPQLLDDGETIIANGRVLPLSLSELRRQTEPFATKGKTDRILPNSERVFPLPSGHLVYNQGGKVFAVPCRDAPLAPSGGPILLAKTEFDSVELAVSSSGDIAIAEGRSRQGELVWVDEASGETTVVWQGARRYGSFRLSPDRQKVAVGVLEDDGSHLWIYDFRNQTRSLLTNEGSSQRPVWTPDGKHVIFRWARADDYGLFSAQLGSRKPPQRLFTTDPHSAASVFSLDGQLKLFHYNAFRHEPGRRDIGEIFEFDMESGVDRPLFQTPDVDESFGELSPDGNWLLYLSTRDTLNYEVFVSPYPGLQPTYRVSRSQAIDPMWSPDGRRIFYRAGTAMDEIRAATVEFDPFNVVKIETLVSNTQDCSGYSFDYDEALHRFLVVRPLRDPPERPEIRWLQNAVK